MNIVAAELSVIHGSPDPGTAAAPARTPAGSFAVVERSESEHRVLVLLDTEADAEAIARELRTRGLKVEVQQAQA